jgi:hypothetical protein
MAVDPETLSDTKLLRNFLENARRSGKDQLVFQCQVRLAKLECDRYETPPEREFWAARAAGEGFASFPPEAVAAARQRLIDHGIEPSKI